MPSINNFLTSFSDGLPGMKDYRHAARLYLDDNYKLLPKQKFLFHVVFDIDDLASNARLKQNEKITLQFFKKLFKICGGISRGNYFFSLITSWGKAPRG